MAILADLVAADVVVETGILGDIAGACAAGVGGGGAGCAGGFTYGGGGGGGRGGGGGLNVVSIAVRCGRFD